MTLGRALIVLGCTSLLNCQQAHTAEQILEVFHEGGKMPYPIGKLTLGRDGNFYCATLQGGKNNDGAIFRITPTGEATLLASFDAKSSGQFPCGGLVQTPDGAIFGTTSSGGTEMHGTVFKLTSDGSFKTIVNFTSKTGRLPLGGLTIGKDGDLYGTTNEPGSIFKISHDRLIILANELDTKTGLFLKPFGELALGRDGTLYGLSETGGQVQRGNVTVAVGMIFRMAPGQAVQKVADLKLKFFSPGIALDTGMDLMAGTQQELVVGKNDVIYGITRTGGEYGDGMLYKVNTGGVLEVLCNFSKTNPDHPFPLGGLLGISDGTMYATVTGNDQKLRRLLFGSSRSAAPRLENGWINYNGKSTAVAGAVMKISEDGKVIPIAVLQGGLSESVVVGADSDIYGVSGGSFFRLKIGNAMKK